MRSFRETLGQAQRMFLKTQSGKQMDATQVVLKNIPYSLTPRRPLPTPHRKGRHLFRF